MDSSLISYSDTLLSTMWTFFMGSMPTLQNTDGTSGHVMPARVMGYAGAAFTFILSAAGAIETGSTLLQKIMENFWSILEDFQDDEDY